MSELAEGAAPRRSLRASPRPRRRLILRVLVGLLLLLVLVMAYQATRTALALRSAQSTAAELDRRLGDGETDGVARLVEQVAADGRTARTHSDGVLWDLASKVPYLGDNVAAVQAVSVVLDDVSSAALPVADRATTLLGQGGLRSADGRFDLDEISALAPRVSTVAESLDASDRRLDALHTAGLLGPLRTATDTVRTRVRDLDRLAGTGATALRLMGPMLGQDGPRRYLLVVQNNAEIRATGGLPAAFSVLAVDDGKISLRNQRNTGQFQVQQEPVLPVTSEERALFGTNLATDIRDTNLPPDFPRTARLMSALLQKQYGTRVDGVVTLDTVALASILKAVRPVEVGEETFTADNVVAKLLNEPYQRFDTQELQNAYFAVASKALFEAVISGSDSVDQPELVRQLGDIARQDRLRVWSRFPAEERELRGTPVAGELPRDTGTTPHVGMYLNDVAAGKVDYYLDYTGSVSSLGCSASGQQTVRAAMTLTSKVPDDVDSLSDWVTGFGQFTAKGNIRVNVRLYAPTGGSTVALSLDGKPVEVGVVEHEGRQVTAFPLVLEPGQTSRLVATVRTRAGQTGPAQLQWTPGMRVQPNTETASTFCG